MNSKMMMIIKFIKRYKLLFGIFCFALCNAFLINAPLSKIPEVFEYGSEIGKIIYDISIGYAVSYIFFYLVVFLKEEKDKKNIKQRISLQATFIVIDGYRLFDIVFNDTGNSKNQFPPTLTELQSACLNIDPFSSSSVLIVNEKGSIPANWQYILRTHRDENLKHIDKILALMPFIDSELVGILTSIEDSKLHNVATNYIFPKHQMPDFKDGTFLEKPLFDFFVIIQKLEKYIRKNFNEMTNHITLLDDKKKQSFE